jgi:YesN/AraC family two-component response regulator
MQIHNEKIDYENPLLSLKIFQSHRKVQTKSLGDWHYHKEMEILAVHKGTLEVHVEEETHLLGAGDVIVIGPSQLHRDRNHDTLHYTVLQFDVHHYFEQSTLPYIQFFSDNSTPLSRLNYIFKESQVRSEVYSCVSEIYKEALDKIQGYEIAVNLLIKKILLTLLRKDDQHVLTANQNPDVLRLKPVLDYIEHHLDDKIIVEDACRLVSMSYYYFVKFFRRTMGMSFTEYVNYKKIKKAERILLTKKMTIASVGECIGMPNMAHFYKVFKKYNQCSPHEYRRKMMGWSS